MNTGGPWADLHLHSHYSDGADSPAEVVQRAEELGCSAIALTDHDTVAGVEEGAAAARRAGLVFFAGTEISAQYGKHEVHILGLGVDPAEPKLLAALNTVSAGRIRRAERIVERLRGLEIPITMEDVAKRAGSGAMGRIHIAQELFAQGYCLTVQDAFDKFIGRGRKAFAPKPALTCDAAIQAIHGAGGAAFLAHPGVGKTGRILTRLLQFPFDGIEAYHSKHTAGEISEYVEAAAAAGLLISGGSDCHGRAKNAPPEMGKVRLAWAHVSALQRALGEGKPAGNAGGGGP